MSLTAPRITPTEILRSLDLVVVAAALPLFIAIDAPIAGYIAAGGAWLAGRIGKAIVDRRRDQALQARNRTAALGLTAATMLGRLWVLAGAILLVGLVGEREAGLAAALMAAALVTAFLTGEGIATLIEEGETERR